MKKLLLILLFLPGCIAVRENILKPVETMPETPLNVSIDIKVSQMNKINALTIELEELSKRLEEKTIKEFQTSKLFKKVGNNIEKPDYELTLNITSQSFNMTHIFFIFSLGIIPDYVSTEVIIQAKLKNFKTSQSTNITFKENWAQWSQIFLVFAMPNNYPTDVLEKMDRDIFDNLIQQTYNQIKLLSN